MWSPMQNLEKTVIMYDEMKRGTNREPEEVKSKDGVIRRNLDRIRVSAVTPQPSKSSRCSQVSLTEKNSTRIHFCLER